MLDSKWTAPTRYCRPSSILKVTRKLWRSGSYASAGSREDAALSGGGQSALLVNRQLNANNQSLRLPVVERQFAPMRQHNSVRD